MNMKGISEVTRDLDVKPHTLREWEKRGYFGEVYQKPGEGRQYDPDQVERIKFIIEQVEDQKTKRATEKVSYDEIDKNFANKYGGMMEPVPQTPNQLFSNVMDQMKQRDDEMKNDLESIKNVLKSVLESKPIELPDTSQQNDLLVSIHSDLLKKIDKLENEKKDLQNENFQLKSELENEQQKSFWQKLKR